MLLTGTIVLPSCETMARGLLLERCRRDPTALVAEERAASNRKHLDPCIHSPGPLERKCGSVMLAIFCLLLWHHAGFLTESDLSTLKTFATKQLIFKLRIYFLPYSHFE